MVSIDHVVLVAGDVRATLEWYRTVLGAEVRDLDAWETGDADYPVLHFGTQKLNVHPAGSPLAPAAARPTAGSLDLCFRWDGDVTGAHQHLVALGQRIEAGPMAQEGARGQGESVYTRDPDGNLVELICYPA